MGAAEKLEGLVYYPNQITSILHINVKDRNYHETFKVLIFTQSGKFIKEIQNNFFHNIAIKVDDLNPGFYSLKVAGDPSIHKHFVVL